MRTLLLCTLTRVWELDRRRKEISDLFLIVKRDDDDDDS
jgi:hypothetical protein